MNERIKELLKQSRRQASEIQTPGSGAYENLVFEKFAELIVRSCSNIAAHHNSLDAAEDIMKHFGVEE